LNRMWITFDLSLLFAIVGFIILFVQYLMVEIWFEVEDLHHETFALSSFNLAIGIFIGTLTEIKQR
jgi:hypothetical protein